MNVVDAGRGLLPKYRIQGDLGKVMNAKVRTCIAGEECFYQYNGVSIGKTKTMEKEYFCTGKDIKVLCSLFVCLCYLKV